MIVIDAVYAGRNELAELKLIALLILRRHITGERAVDSLLLNWLHFENASGADSNSNRARLLEPPVKQVVIVAEDARLIAMTPRRVAYCAFKHAGHLRTQNRMAARGIKHAAEEGCIVRAIDSGKQWLNGAYAVVCEVLASIDKHMRVPCLFRVLIRNIKL